MLAIIIPNYNGQEHLVTCFESIEKQSYRDYQVILVDNGSTDDSVNFTKEKYPQYSIIKLDRNYGFAKAINEGIRLTLDEEKYSHILLLNNDIELHPEFLKYGLETFVNDPSVSFEAVKMLNYYNRDKIDDCGDFIKGNGGSPLARGFHEKDTGQYDREEYIFGACAGAAFYRKELFEKVGLFDETFFAYYEDIDFSFRAQLMGYKCLYQPKALCYHKRGGTINIATEGFQTELCERNLLILRAKNYPLSLYILYQPFFFAARLKRYFIFLLRHPVAVFLRAVKGYLRGSYRLLFILKSRKQVQNSKLLSSQQVKSLFVK